MQQNNLNNLIINKMTQAQYDTITPASDELYFITDGVLQSSDVINALGYTPVNKAGDVMTGNLAVLNGTPRFYLRDKNEVAGTSPSADITKQLNFQDKNSVLVGYVGNTYLTTGERYTVIASKDASGNNGTEIRVGYDSNGNVYTYAPKPALTSNNNNIATTNLIDGNWTFPSSSTTICSNLSVNGSGTEDFALNTVLPNDGNLYEMILSCHGETGSASGNRVQLMLSSSNTFNGDMRVFDTIARSAARVFGGGTVMFPAKSTTTLKVAKNSVYTGTVTISCIAYRKVR